MKRNPCHMCFAIASVYVLCAVAASALPVTDGLILRLDANAIQGLTDGDHVTEWPDTSGNENHFVAVPHAPSGFDPLYPLFKENAFPQGPAVFLGRPGSGHGPYIRNPDGIGVTVNGGMTMILVIRPTVWSGGNPGIWRSGSTSGGNEFMIMSGSTGRPWIRWAGSNILNPGSGYEWPLNEDALTTWVVRNNDNAEFFVNGDRKHHNTHSISVASSSLYNIGYQHTIENRVEGYYAEILFYDRPLSDSERQSVEQYLQAKWFEAPAPGGTVIRFQ